MGLAGSPEALINPGNIRAKGAPRKNQWHLSYALLAVSPLKSYQSNLRSCGSHFGSESRCFYCTEIFLLYSSFGPGDAPWLIIPLGTSLILPQLMVTALVCPSGEAGKICATALSNSPVASAHTVDPSH